MKRTITLVASTPFLLSACGLLFTKGPPVGHEKMMTPFSCTESWTAPGLDILLGLLNIGFAMQAANDPDAAFSSTEQTYWSVIGTVIFGGSAAIGIDRISRCNAALRALTERQAEAAAALAARRRSADLIGVQKVLITGGRDSNDTIASVSAAGLVRARRVGTALITANTGNVVGTVDVVIVLPIERKGASR